MAAERIRRVTSRKELESVQDDFMTQGYVIVREGETSILMRKGTWGSGGNHVIVAVLTIWWTAGLGNLVYALVAHNSADQVMLRLEVPAPDYSAPIATGVITPGTGLAGA